MLVGSDVAIVVPMKGLRTGKSRLSEILAPLERYDLNLRLLGRTLQTARKIVNRDQLFVVSGCSETLTFSEPFAETIFEETAFDLNKALDQAVSQVREAGFRSVLVLHSDLPLLTRVDLDDLVKRRFDYDVVIVADKRQSGTNALLLSNETPFRFHFGLGSLERHCLEAERHKLRWLVVRNHSLAFDIDTPDDYNASSAITLNASG